MDGAGAGRCSICRTDRDLWRAQGLAQPDGQRFDLRRLAAEVALYQPQMPGQKTTDPVFGIGVDHGLIAQLRAFSRLHRNMNHRLVPPEEASPPGVQHQLGHRSRMLGPVHLANKRLLAQPVDVVIGAGRLLLYDALQLLAGR